MKCANCESVRKCEKIIEGSQFRRFSQFAHNRSKVWNKIKCINYV